MSQTDRSGRSMHRLAVLLAMTSPWVSAGRAGADEAAAEKIAPNGFWAVDDVKPGMRGIGKTVMHGTAIEQFDV